MLPCAARAVRDWGAAGEGGIEPMCPDQQLDQPPVGFRCGKRIGPDEHPDLPPAAAQLYQDRQGLGFAAGRVRRWRSGRIKKRAEPCRADMDVDPIGPDVDALDQGSKQGTLACRGKPGQLLPSSLARATSQRCADASTSPVAL